MIATKITMDPIFSIMFFDEYPSHSNYVVNGSVSVIPKSICSAGSKISKAVTVIRSENKP